jgi:NitT/TauT family transport system ATP-binding protein
VYVITPRPGRVAGVVEVDLPRPRSLELVTTEAFQGRAREVRRLLDLGAMDEEAGVGSERAV